ncbi:hypothetical protein ACFFTN_20380 [Aminobacter aganoensis]|uniref:Lipoprotein n=1 Tax=Aminobacter aganoensis TaxID=83264 RepID=A0A7X0F3G4_9HYPH|nr:hypothetical protein [Aminobacter aganoensis]MBB6352390.1 hypothetical protein [Aminobacter aganoensis]
MRSHTVSFLMATVLLPLSGCGSLLKVEEQAAVQPAAQPVQVKKAAPAKKVAVAAPVQPKVVKRPTVAATVTSNERSDSGGGDTSDW